MVHIYMENVYSKIVGLDPIMENKIEKLLSYKVGGFGAKVETKTLFNVENKTTLTGLVPKVLLLLSRAGIKYNVVDLRKKPEPNANFKIQDGFKARDYQQEIIDRASSREIIQAATGAGKTFIMANLIVKFQVKPVVVIAPKVSLAEQIKNEFEKFLGVKVGIVGGGYYDIQDITVSTPMSAPDELLESAKAIFWDEAHNIPSNSIFKCGLKAKNAYYRIGVSATPWRDGGDDLLIEATLSIRRPNLSINASKLIAKGNLTPCNIIFLPIKEEFEWNGSYHDLYKRAIVYNEKRNSIIVNLAKKMTFEKNRTTLILIKNIEHGNIIKKQLEQIIDCEKFNINVDGENVEVSTVEFLSGQDNSIKRKAVFQAVKENKTRILIGSTIADEGLDLPKLDCLILAGSGKSSTRAFQRIGRVLRLYEGKKDAIVFDFMDYTKTFKRHAKIREALYKTEPLWKIIHYDK